MGGKVERRMRVQGKGRLVSAVLKKLVKWLVKRLLCSIKG
jgi:hypothetical protein